MARKSTDGEINKSEEIRTILRNNPRTKTSEVITLLEQRGIKVAPGLVYFIKGKMKRRRPKKVMAGTEAVKVGAPVGNSDVLNTIKKVKSLAAEVGSMRKLRAIVEELNQ